VWVISRLLVLGGQQVGCVGNISFVGSPDWQAYMWNGSSENGVYLHALLPNNYIESNAQGIDSYGNIIGYALVADTHGTEYHAVVWEIPDPASISMLVLGGVGQVRRRRKG